MIRKILPVKEKPFPSCLWAIEPHFCSEELSEGRYKVVASEWYARRGIGGRFRGAETAWYLFGDLLLDTLERCAVEDGRVVVIGWQMEEICHLLAVSTIMRERGWRGAKYFVSSRVVILEIKKGGRVITFCDLRNWLPFDFNDVCNWVGVKVEPVMRFWPNESASVRYHEGVLDGVCGAWDKFRDFVEKEELGGFAYTLSSLSYGYWTRREESKKLLKSSKEWVQDAARQAYYGGFVYVHAAGEHRQGPYYLLDCNGLYAWVMQRHRLPFREYTTCRVPRDGDLDVIEGIGEGLVYGCFELPNGYLARRDGRKIEWDHGPRLMWLPWPEVQWVREHGIIHAIYQWVVYEVDYFLSPVVREYLNRRRRDKVAGKRIESKIWKNMSNFLYGKFGQRYGQSIIEEAEDGARDGKQLLVDYQTDMLWTEIVWCGSRIIIPENGGGRAEYSVVAAWVTSHARVRLWQLCEQAGWNNVLYNATDSLIVNQQGYERLRDQIVDDVPGMLKVEASGDVCHIFGRNQYSVGSKTVDGTLPNLYFAKGDGRLVWAGRDSSCIVEQERVGVLYMRQQFRDRLVNAALKYAQDMEYYERQVG